MSGSYGWNGRDRSLDSVPAGTGFTRARQAYNDPSPARSRVLPSAPDDDKSVRYPASQVVAAALTPYLDLAPRALKSTAANVLVVEVDVTGSMREWIQEIFDRLPLLYKETQKYLGDDLEILFIGFGDVAFHDKIEVASFGRGQVLDTYITAFDKNANGGGNGIESAEVVAVYVDKMVDTSTAKNVYMYTITDEGLAATVEPSLVRRGVNVACEREPTKNVYDRLLMKGCVYTLFAATNTGRNSGYEKTWVDVLGRERVLPLNDARRVVDVMLGVMAKLTDQLDQFTQDLHARQGGTKFGSVNIANVHQTIALVNNGSPKPPQITGGTKRLILDGDGK